MNNTRNMFMAFGLSMLVVLSWTYLADRYAPKPTPAQISAQQQTTTATASGLPALASGQTKPIDRAAALGASPRIAIATSTLTGSINLKGAQIDDLVLTKYQDSIAKNAPNVVLYTPQNTATSALASFGWSGANVPAPDTVWQADGTKLTPEAPVTLHWGNGQGQLFSLKISIDNNYMFTVQQSVVNNGAAPVSLASYAFVSRNYPAIDKPQSAHLGPIADVNGKVDYDVDYTHLDGQEPGFFAKLFGTSAKAGENTFAAKGGWVGFGDKYWLSAVIPAQNAQLNAGFRKDGNEYRAGYAGVPAIIGAGQTQSTTAHLFAGAKEVDVLDGYEANLGIPRFGKAADWGWFEIIAKPFFHLIHWLFQLTGNFGVAVILTTFIIRGLMFPIAQRQFASMAKMKVLQPKMKALQERFKDDKPALQKETMKLYQTEKINPAAGCLPIFLQIPVFYALYKVLSISIEMRHQPFTLWLHDLSAPDPVLFGLFPSLQTALPGFLAIGILPILLGVSMWAMQKANPAPADPAQAQMMAIMPWMMMFFFANMPAGLQLYYVVSNSITIVQQRVLMARHAVPAATVPSTA